jgi:exopolysaccharide production protein ExoQ
MNPRWQWLLARSNEAFVAGVVALQVGILTPWFGVQADGEGTVQQGAFAAAYAISALLLVIRVASRRRIRASWWYLWVLAFFALATTSMLWSDLPQLTLRRVIALAGTLVFAVWVAETMTPRRMFRSVVLGLLLVAAASYVTLAVAPQRAIHGGGSHVGNWRGALWHKNLLGREMALATTLTLASAAVAPRRQRRALLVAAGLAATLVIGARSVTGIVLLVAGVATVILAALPAADARERLGRTVLWVTAVVAGSAVIWAFGAVALDALGRDLTFTGRDRVWEVTYDVLRERVWTGHGFGAFWDGPGGAEVSRVLDYRVVHAHNGLLQIASSLGVPGVVLVVTLYLGLLSRAVRSPALLPVRPAALGFLVHFALLGVSDAVMSGPNSLSLTLAVAILLTSPKAQGEVAAAPTPSEGHVATRPLRLGGSS